MKTGAESKQSKETALAAAAAVVVVVAVGDGCMGDWDK